MPTVNLSPVFNGWQGFNSAGTPLAGGLLNTYAAGTSTPQATYMNSAGTIANSNPIQLGTDGRPPGGIWLTFGQSYKFVLTDALGANPFSYDNVQNDAAVNLSALSSTANAAGGAALVGFNPNMAYPSNSMGAAQLGVIYGATANGIVDDTVYLQAAVDLAASLGAGLDGGGRYYGVCAVRLKSGLKHFRNFRLKAVTAGQQSLLELAGYTYSNAPVGAQTLATKMTIENNDLDCNNIAPMAVFGQGNSDIVIRRNSIYNIPSTSSNNCGIQFSSGVYGVTGAAPSNIRIIDNDIVLPVIAFGGFTMPGIYILGATAPTTSASGPSSIYQSTGNIPRASPAASVITITGNKISNGYYGIAVQGMDSSVISGNVILGQGSRCMNIIDSWSNVISNNRLTGWNISAINCSFGSWYNKISENYCERTTTVATDNFEGAVQTYVFVRGNHIHDNRIKTNGRYGIYAGLDATDCTISDNWVEGATLAQIAVEANWLSGMSPAVPAEALYSRTSSTPQSQASMFGMRVANNHITPSTTSCAIYLSCIASIATILAGENVVSGNHIYGTALHYIYVVGVSLTNGSTNSISGLKLTDNLVHNGDQSVARVYINRTGNGRSACTECHGNSIINHLPIHTGFADQSATPNVSDADEWMASNTVATNITGIVGGMVGQRINLHLAANVTLKHNAAQSLKGGVDATVPTFPSRALMQLRFFDRWVEEFRNF